MSICGSTEIYSLPEIFQIIGLGNKSGKLKFIPNSTRNTSESNEYFTFWFMKGHFVTIVHSLKYEGLIEKIQSHDWINSRTLVKCKNSITAGIPLGIYLRKKNLLDSTQIELLFIQQLNESTKLFNIKDGWFEFKEVNSKDNIARWKEKFPWSEMTGKKKKATELSLEAMRDFSDWSRFSEEIPSSDIGLRRLAPSQSLQFTHLEQILWDEANGSASLKTIAKEQSKELKLLQRTALSMIFAGLVEEVVVTSNQQLSAATFSEKRQPHIREHNNIAVKTKAKPKVSSSLINNLVSFLKDKF